MSIEVDYLGCKVIKPELFQDERGYFFESYNKRNFKEQYGIDNNFVQNNESYSQKGVLRGLHYQLAPFAQAKLVRVTKGAVLDIAVDIRRSSKNFGSYFSVILSGDNKKQLFIPKGFAHGFIVLSEEARFCYKCDNFYNKKFERGIKWDDPELNIDWQFSSGDIIISDKDRSLPYLSEADIPSK